jgi:photosystem II stability/assembly factor-like uncharacterized protein
MRLSILLLLAVLPLPAALAAPAPSPKPSASPEEPKKGLLAPDTWKGLELRSIGPALTSGRVVDLAVDPRHPERWFVAAAAGGVWKTVNAGTSFMAVFDDEKSFSIGCVTIDPNDSAVVWVGSGENNSQRVVAYGDGVYRSDDAGKSWTNVGLQKSEHIGKILVDPRDSHTVYVAAQGPLWAPGGDRGLYKTTDNGKTWKAVLTISENTGVTDVAMDPRNPDILYAAAYQRRRHVFTLIDGGPESALYKSTDAGATWNKLKTGLPKEDMGRIGLAISPVDPDVVYAVIEAANKGGGFFRSTDRGATWEKRGDYVPGGPQYYNEIFADPFDRDRVYSMDVWMRVTDDGGKTFRKLGETWKHPDNHVIWIDPKNADHYIVGCDGGIYETFDRAVTWDFKANLPVTQFYRVATDNATPYNVYGGTQDNFSLGGPSRTTNVHGIANSDWFVTWSGDGFVSAIDPEDPNVVYAEAQYGALGRYDRRTGEAISIQPQEAKGEEQLHWNWDSPLIISPHKHTRLYFAANKVFRSEDRGDSWTQISGDLSRKLDRNAMKVMGRVWGPDAVAKNSSTSIYGNVLQLAESPKQEGLLYAGTDDGLLQVTEDGGANWRRIERFPGVPDQTLVDRLLASSHDPSTVYAAFDNHQNGDFKPYLLKSTDRGRTWTSVAGNLPERGTVYALAEDPVDPGLLFVGTEFGLYFTRDGGTHWVRLTGGFPTIAVRDLTIQARETDLVVGTFGRGIYILDDYTPLRRVTAADLEKDAYVFPVKPVTVAVPTSPLGLRGKAMMGESYYTAPNPPFGATFTYHLKDDLKPAAKRRRAAEKDALKANKDVPYPTREALRAEAEEEDPAVIVTVSDASGHAVRRLTGSSDAGIHRVSWDLRYPPSNPTSLKPAETDPFSDPVQGPMAAPGRYTVTFARRVEGRLTPFGEPQAFEARGTTFAPAEQRQALLAFQQKTARLQRAVLGAVEAADAAQDRIQHIKQALMDTPGASPALFDEARAIEAKLRASLLALRGDEVMRARNEPVPPAIVDRVQGIVGSQWSTTTAPTGTNQQAYAIAAEEFARELAPLRAILDVDLKHLEDQLETAGAPWTPGRVPVWSPE